MLLPIHEGHSKTLSSAVNAWPYM